MSTLVIASHNEGKVGEFRELLAPLGFTIKSAGELNLPEPEETGKTFEENAELKARAAVEASGELCLADDSGLCVAALGGAPGIYSARWAGPNKDFYEAMKTISSKLHARNVEPTGSHAYFVCVLSLAYPDGRMVTLRGECHGSLVFPARGFKGFGYDPIFVPTGSKQTFGEMEPAAKHAMSHRAKAFTKLLDHLKQERAA